MDPLTLLRLGFTEANRSAYIMIGNKNWKSIEAGKDYDLKFQFDRLSPWSGTATGSHIGKTKFPMLFIIFSKPDFLKEFGRKHLLRVTYKGSKIALLKLRGSKLALDEMLLCQRAMRDYSPSTSSSRKDPFSGSSKSPVKDPFQ